MNIGKSICCACKTLISPGYPNPAEMSRLGEVSSMLLVNFAQVVFGPAVTVAPQEETPSPIVIAIATATSISLAKSSAIAIPCAKATAIVIVIAIVLN